MTGHQSDQSLIIVSNRGPAQFELDAHGERTLTRGGGGLVTALSGLVANRDALWIASAMTSEDVIVTDRDEIARRLPEVCKVIVEEGDEGAKHFLLSRIAEIALADGALMDREAEVIHEVAKMLEVPEKAAYAVIVGAAQSVGFRADVKLNRIAAQLRRSLKPRPGPA